MKKVSLFLLVLSSTAFANVSLKNGNFFIGYRDLSYSGGFETKIERVYNSKTPYNGFFGWGWGNEYEVQIKPTADGSLMVLEYGGGSENRFIPAKKENNKFNDSINELVLANKQTSALGSSAQVESYKKRLKQDSFYRYEEYERLAGLGKIKRKAVADGTQFISMKFSFQYITKTKTGYVRKFDNGKIEFFDQTGKLAKVSDKNGNFVQIYYTRDGKIEKMVDSANRKLFFTFNTLGKIAKIQGENKKEAIYKYNNLGELIYAKGVDGEVYVYSYTKDARHNLNEITYENKTSQKIAYFDKNKFENVKSIKDKDGTVTEYDYEYKNTDKNYLKVKVALKDKDGTSISNSSYEYFFKNTEEGDEWNYRMVSILDGDSTDTYYHEQFGLPTLIKKSGEQTSFEYDSRARVVSKTTPDESTKLTYDPKAGKVAKVERFSVGDNKRKSWSVFEYDAKGNLMNAKDSVGKQVNLFYDSMGRVKSMIDQSKRRLDFKYNENSKPVEISDPKLGAIVVSYNNSGEIKKVDSPAGRKIALQVTSAFQNLLEIIRPAGVSLSF